jgi:G:T-mismatch repair DNA endonuclease (very short patch repair protein)
MPWGTVGQNTLRPERAREALGKTGRVKSNWECSMEERFYCPSRAEGLIAFQSQGIARGRDALGCILMTFQAIQ